MVGSINASMDTEPLEGAVGFQNPSHANDYSLHRLMVNEEVPQVNEDSENNNVDENSNDHQYPQYANYHQQFQQHRYVADDEQNLPNASSIPQNSVRNRTHNLPPEYDILPRTNRRLSESRIHRRNLSEDLSYFNSQPLPPRHDLTDSTRHMPLYDRFLPTLPRRHYPSQEEVNSQAKELLYNYTLEQFQEQHITPPEEFSAIARFSDPAWASTGRELRNLADAFSRSQERNIVRSKAQAVSMESLNIEDFFHLCSELFQGQAGITQERIVVLFTFISDVAIHHVRVKAERFLRQLMTWSLNFIYERICSWVQQAGGWNVVLTRSANFVYKWTIFTLAAVGIVALGIYIKKSIKEL